MGLNAELEALRSLHANSQRQEGELRSEIEASEGIIKDLRNSALLMRARLEENERLLNVSESRRRMLELEMNDRAAWREQQQQQKSELVQERVQLEKARRQADIEEALKRIKELREEEERKAQARKEQQEKEEQTAAEQARAEAERQRREERRREEERQKEERRQKEWAEATRRETQRCLRRNTSEWGVGSTWSIAKSLSRVKTLVGEMEKLKFSESQPFTSHVVPWPVLGDPALFVASELEWSSVDTFFERVQLQFDSAGYKEFVHRVHLMYHPDRWKSKGYLVTVQDEEERGVLERAGNVVSQAVTPLWRKTRSW